MRKYFFVGLFMFFTGFAVSQVVENKMPFKHWLSLKKVRAGTQSVSISTVSSDRILFLRL